MDDDLAAATGTGTAGAEDTASPATPQPTEPTEPTEPGTSTDTPAGAAAADAVPGTAEGGSGEDASGEDAEPPKRKRGRPKGSTARTTRVVTMTLTVSGSADGDWQAELKQGSSWVARGLPVSASAVSQAAAALHADLAGPVDELIESARASKAARVAELEAELERARKDLAELER